MDEEKRKKQSQGLNSKTKEILDNIHKRSREDLRDKDVEALINDLQLYQVELESHCENLRQSQSELEKSREQYFELYNLAPVGYFTLTPTGIIEEANLMGAEMLGVPRRMLQGARFSSYVTAPFHDGFHSHCLTVIKTKEGQSCDLKMKTIDGSEFWIEMKSAVELNVDGEPKGIRATIIDITEGKKREKTERLLADIMQNIPDAVIMQDISGKILAWNKGATALYGYDKDEALEMNIDRILPNHKRDEMKEIGQRLIAGEKIVYMTTQRITKTGRVLHVLASFSIQFEDNSSSATISSIERDITIPKKNEAERNRLIRQLAREQKLLETILNQLPVGIIIAEPPDGKVIMKNDFVDEIFRFAWSKPQKYDEYGTRRKIYYQDGRSYTTEDIPLLRATKYGETVRDEVAIYRRGDGSRGMLNMNAAPVRDENGEIIAGIVIVQDITSRVEKEQQAKDGRQFADNIIGSMGDGLLVLDENMKVVRCNLSFCNTFNERTANVEGRLFFEIGSKSWNIPELRNLLLRIFTEARPIIDYEVIKKFPNIGRRIMIINGRPVLGREGKPDLILLTLKDVTNQRAAEEEIQRLNAMLLKRYVELQNANRELEAFTYSVSHDLRGPLRAMDGFSRLLQEEYSGHLDDNGRHYLERIRSGADSMSNLIDDLLRLSRISQTDIVYADVNLSAIVAEFAEELTRSNPDRKVSFEIQPDLIVRGDNNLLRQLLENLIRNAWKYSKEKPEAVIEFGMMEIEGEKSFYVHDNGAGFDMKYANKLFMPFQRLHSSKEYSGTGIGLSIVKRIVDGHDGKVWAEAKEGAGATFYFTIGNQEDQ